MRAVVFITVSGHTVIGSKLDQHMWTGCLISIRQISTMQRNNFLNSITCSIVQADVIETEFKIERSESDLWAGKLCLESQGKVIMHGLLASPLVREMGRNNSVAICNRAGDRNPQFYLQQPCCDNVQTHQPVEVLPTVRWCKGLPAGWRQCWRRNPGNSLGVSHWESRLVRISSANNPSLP